MSEAFSIAYTGLRRQARVYGLDPNTHNMVGFLKNTAEVMAQAQEEVRRLTNIQHNRELQLDWEDEWAEGLIE